MPITKLQPFNLDSNASYTFGTVTATNFVGNGSQLTGIVTGTAVPTIASIAYPGDNTATDVAGGETITLNGTGFVTGCSVIINGSPAGAVTFISSTQITFIAPALTAGTYILYVVNSDGSTAISVPGISYSGVPSFYTGAGTVGTVYEATSFNSNVAAAGDSAITYTIASGLLPSGATLNANGIITGTSVLTGNATTYTFGVKASDGQNQDVVRTYTITVNPDTVSWSSPTDGSTITLGQNISSTTALTAASAAGKAITYTANALPSGLSISGNVVTGTPTVAGNTTTLLTANATSTTRTATITVTWNIAVLNDQYFNYTTLLLTGTGSNNATNNTFVDSSSNNFAITRSGNATQGTFSPYGPNWSNYFDGAGDYLTAASPSMSGTWTIELWWYPTVGGVQQTFVSYNSGTNGSLGTIGINIWMNTSNQLVVDNGQVASGLFTGGTFTINAWNHVAVVRNGTTTTGYINGASVGSNTFTPGGVNQINVGRYPDGNNLTFYYMSGYISNLRVVTGTAVYTSAFTPPTAPLTAISGTSLLTCQSNRFIDNSTNNYTITRNGDVSVRRFSPFGPGAAYSTSTIGGSGYFDGTGDYLTTNCTINWSTYGSYTLEFWVYHTTMSPANQWYFVGGTGGTGNTIFYNYANGRIGVGINGTNEIVSSSGVIKANTWQHIAYTFNGTTTTIYVDGVQVASGTTAIYANSSITLGVGGGSDNASTAMNGYIANMRLSQSVIYPSSFTPPASPVTGGALLLNFTNAGIADGTMLNNLETVGGVQISTAQSKFGGSSMYFDGTGDYLVCRDSPGQEFGAGNLTWEMWINTTNSTQYATLYSRTPASFSTGMWSLLMNFTSSTSGDLALFVGDYNLSSGLMITTGANIRDGNWHHIAVVRNGSAWAIYVDGTSKATATWAGTIADIAYGTYIGADQFYGRAFTGYIDDLRITKGYARYTANFTPPTAALIAR